MQVTALAAGTEVRVINFRIAHPIKNLITIQMLTYKPLSYVSFCVADERAED